MTGLERFIEAKREEMAALERMDENAMRPWQGIRPSFLQALKSDVPELPAVIAEYKRASPSRGVICESLEPEEVARQYAGSCANALSVLTEERYFHGSIDFLFRMAGTVTEGGRIVPMLRKDFLFHPLQVTATLATPASALLLIVRLTPDVRLLRDLREQAEAGGVEAVVEVFDERDLALARESGARVIQVNARDLVSLRVDRQACLRLATSCPPRSGELWVAASGMSRRRDLEEAARCGFSAVLVGSALVEGGKPGKALRRLLTGEEIGHAD